MIDSDTILLTNFKLNSLNCLPHNGIGGVDIPLQMCIHFFLMHYCTLSLNCSRKGPATVYGKCQLQKYLLSNFWHIEQWAEAELHSHTERKKKEGKKTTNKKNQHSESDYWISLLFSPYWCTGLGGIPLSWWLIGNACVPGPSPWGTTMWACLECKAPIEKPARWQRTLWATPTLTWTRPVLGKLMNTHSYSRSQIETLAAPKPFSTFFSFFFSFFFLIFAWRTYYEWQRKPNRNHIISQIKILQEVGVCLKTRAN